MPDWQVILNREGPAVWKYPEIAAEMAISVNAVGVLLHRARKRLQHQLKDSAAVPGSPSRSLTRRTLPPITRKDLP
jgi:hypothetical protein